MSNRNAPRQIGCLDHLKFGFMLGGSLGLASGFMFGFGVCVRSGLRGREFIRALGSSMLNAGLG